MNPLDSNSPENEDTPGSSGPATNSSSPKPPPSNVTPATPLISAELDLQTAMNQSATAHYREPARGTSSFPPTSPVPSHHDATQRRHIEELRRLLALETDNQSPDTLGCMDSYTLLNIVGAGGMGIVARAFDRTLHRNVAIKVMSDRLARNERSRKRFLREARTAASINHPNVVTIHAVNDRNDIPYLVMEYIEGKTLHDRIRDTAPMTLVDVLRIGAQIAEGLAAAHRCGIIHRDVKPGNVLLENSVERVKLTDFGLARVIVENSDITSIDDVVGTPAYMSPEQVDGKELTVKSDLFSFGCVMYAMFAGRSPFYGPTSLVCAQRVKELQPPALTEIDPAIPPELEQLIFKLLAKSPVDRPDSAHMVAQTLLDWAAHANLSNSQQRKRQPVLPSTPTPSRIAWVFASIAIFALLAAFGYSLLRTPMQNQIRFNSVATPALDPMQDGKLYVDAKGGEFSSLRAALAVAEPNTTIELGPGVYTGPFEIFDSARLAGLTITGQPGATLHGSGDAPLLRIVDVASVTISGLRFEMAPRQIGINVSGFCPGLQLQQLELIAMSPEQTAVESIRFDLGASGRANAPLTVSQCNVDGGGVGIVIGSHDSQELPVQFVHVDDCKLAACSTEYGIPIVIQGPTQDILVTNNLIYRGLGGLSLRFDRPQQAQRIRFESNSLCHVTKAMFFNDSPTEEDVHIDNNVFAMTESLSTPSVSVDRYETWLHGNQWLAYETPTDPLVLRAFEQLPVTSVVSIDMDSDDFMKPSPMSNKFLRGKTASDQ